MTRPAPRPLASVTRIRTPAEQVSATLPAYRLAALHALAATAAAYVTDARDRQRKGWDKTHWSELDKLEARVLALAATLEMEAGK